MAVSLTTAVQAVTIGQIVHSHEISFKDCVSRKLMGGARPVHLSPTADVAVRSKAEHEKVRVAPVAGANVQTHLAWLPYPVDPS